MIKNKKKPKDHYIPQFYLSRWTTNGSLFSAKYIEHIGKISWTPRSPKETGYERGLYGEVEKTFFMPLDDKASKIVSELHDQGITSLQKMELGEKNHDMWAKYILAQIIRVPKYVNEVYRIYNQSGIETGAAINQLPSIIQNKKAIKDVRSLKWLFVKIESNLELITSDNPIIFKPRNLRNKSCILILPMGPHHFFLATHERNIGRIENNPRKLVSYINQEIISNSVERIYARSRHSIKNEFILKHWKKAT